MGKNKNKRDGVDLTTLKRKQLRAIVDDSAYPKADRKAAKAELRRRAESEPIKGEPEAPEVTVDDVFVSANGKPVAPDKPGSARKDDAEPGESEVEYQTRKGRERKAAEPVKAPTPTQVLEAAERVLNDPNASPGAIESAKKARKKAKKAIAEQSEPEVDPTSDEAIKARVSAKRAAREAASDQVAEEVVTEQGREFAVGAAKDDTPAIVAADESHEGTTVERDHLDRPKIVQLDESGQVILETRGERKGQPKTRAYTRVTTYIDCLEDTSLLEQWKIRTALVGASSDARLAVEQGRGSESIMVQVEQVVDEFDRALRRIAKRERKGELDLGQFGLLRAEAVKAHRDALNALGSRALDLGGVHDKATKGTNLHALTALYDEGKVRLTDEAQLDDLIESGVATASDIADLRVYAKTMADLGIKHVAIEQFVVLDDLMVAGTLDRASLFRFPGTSRAVRCVGDLKTGRVDYSAGKIGMQLGLYSRGMTYDPSNPTARGDLKLSKSKGLLIHLPQGEARCTVYEVDLTLAAKGIALAGQVRAWRNEGKRTYDLKAPIEVEAIVNGGS